MSREILEKLGVRPKKRFGQNFLFQKGVVENIFRFIGDLSGASVIEIGPGLGALTAGLIKQSKNYQAVELESAFCAYLKTAYPEAADNIFQADIREFSLSKAERYTIVSNLPYSISSEVCFWIFDNRERIERAVLLLQREFAERLAAAPGSKDYGILSVICALHADCRLGDIVGGKNFYPATEVDSRLIELRILKEPRVSLTNEQEFREQEFRQLVRAAFSARRKTLLNSLYNSKHYGDKNQVLALLKNAKIEPERRAETLNLFEFAEIFGQLATFRPTQ